MTLLLPFLARQSILVLIGLLLTIALRRRSAAARHWALAAALFAGAAVAPLSLALPSWTVVLPSPVRETEQAPGQPPVPLSAVPGTARPGGPRQATSLPPLILVWLAGVGVSAGTLGTGFLRIRRLAARAERLEDGPCVRTAAEVSREYGIGRPVTVLRTSDPVLVATWGARTPCVLLPAAARDWSQERLRIVLAHELAHVRRQDWLVQVFAEGLRALAWVNPLLWLACSRLRRESEQACDDMVLATGVPATEYASHLLALAGNGRRPPPAWVPMLSMARPSTLERRVAAMLNPDLDRRQVSRSTAALMAVGLLAVALPAAALRAGQGGPRSLTGSVYDTTGAVLPGVELRLADERELAWEAITDAAGRFEFPPVEPGRYELEATLPGFHSLRQELELGDEEDWDRAITLQVGEVMETIVVREQRVARPAAEPADAAEPVRVGGNVRPPLKTHDVKPIYPAAMREAGREGRVPMEAVIGRDGTVKWLRVVSAQVHPDFATAAADAVRQWRFEPTLLNGETVEVVMTVSVEFDLSD